MIRALTPRLFALVAAAVIALALVRVTLVPAPTQPTPHSLRAVIDEGSSQVHGAVAGLREVILQQKSNYEQMWSDTRDLTRRLGGSEWN